MRTLMVILALLLPACSGSRCVGARVPYCGGAGMAESVLIEVTREVSAPTEPLCGGEDGDGGVIDRRTESCPTSRARCNPGDPGCPAGSEAR